MSLQNDMFADRVNARHTDPESSAAADAWGKATGIRRRRLDVILALLAAHPLHTSRELAAVGGIDRHEAGRRLSDLKHMGLAMHSASKRPDRAGGRPGVEWRLTTHGVRALQGAAA